MSKKIKQHPDEATLMSFAAGTLAEPLAAVVAAHAALCSRCRAELADLELLGAALLLGEAPATNGEVSVTPRMAAARTQTASEAPVPRQIAADERLPAPIAQTYGLSFDTRPGKRLGPGVWHHRLPLTPGVEGDLRLLKIGPGREMPDHGHGGSELTLVLDGAFSDATGSYLPGDLQDVDEEQAHKPLADKVTGCICLIASEKPARFKGLVGRLLQPLTGM